MAKKAQSTMDMKMKINEDADDEIISARNKFIKKSFSLFDYETIYEF